MLAHQAWSGKTIRDKLIAGMCAPYSWGAVGSVAQSYQRRESPSMFTGAIKRRV